MDSLHSLHFTHFTHFTSQERARLAGDDLRTEHARLAQGGFWGQIYKRNPFKRNFLKI